MKTIHLFVFFLLLGCCVLTTTADAQKKQVQKKTVKSKTAASGKTAVLLNVTLGKSAIADSVMTPEEFNRRVQEGLKVANPEFPNALVNGFDFTYMERNIYEDSVGNFIQVVDVLTERCPGDTFTAVAKSAMRYRAKAGDTALFNNMQLLLPDGRTGIGREFKIVLQEKK